MILTIYCTKDGIQYQLETIQSISGWFQGDMTEVYLWFARANPGDVLQVSEEMILVTVMH